ncbi:hypothetical protein WM40_03085 [Robbsia andropogonis]|uniref:3-oxoacyl-ACP synthase n=1 Tax=Robbsia andropogonis TaxID=28092 RepID=A0A0F5K4A6_9BURK|nr:hypothetical protein [Robbsia andropogonis]KKB64966.1 hypothetical protein WM40_03085 [Robbsia andropogonis]
MTVLMLDTPASADAHRSQSGLAANGRLAMLGGVAVLPPSNAFSDVQAQERHPGYRHLLLPQAHFARPRGIGKITDQEIQHLKPNGRPVLRIAPPGRSLSDLAADAAIDLRDQLGSGQFARTTHIVLASCALNEAIGDSVVGRMQYELGLNHVLPLALGQNGTLGMYATLTLLEGLLGDDDQALVILSDKWLYPFFRQFGDLVGYSDAAAAILVRRATDMSNCNVWGSPRSVAVEFGDAITDPWASSSAAVRDALAPLAARAIRRALEDARLKGDEIDWFVAPGIDPTLAVHIADMTAVPRECLVRHDLGGHLSSADSMVSLLRLASSLDRAERRTALVWDIALHGAAAAAVFDVIGGFRVVLDIEGSTV